MQPMLATRGDHVPSGPDWQHEVKWDGMRTLVEVAGGRVRVFSRNERDVSVSFPELAGLAEALDHDVLLDGEVVSFAERVPSFGALADRMHVRDPRRAAALAATGPGRCHPSRYHRIGRGRLFSRKPGDYGRDGAGPDRLADASHRRCRRPQRGD